MRDREFRKIYEAAFRRCVHEGFTPVRAIGLRTGPLFYTKGLSRSQSAGIELYLHGDSRKNELEFRWNIYKDKPGPTGQVAIKVRVDPDLTQFLIDFPNEAAIYPTVMLKLVDSCLRELGYSAPMESGLAREIEAGREAVASAVRRCEAIAAMIERFRRAK